MTETKDSSDESVAISKESDAATPVNESDEVAISEDSDAVTTENTSDSTNGSHIVSGDNLAPYFLRHGNEKNIVLASEVPEICRTEPCMLGVDEAGRGPVLGPMVYGVCYCPVSREADLREMGCADSKVLTEAKREEVFTKICAAEAVGWAIEAITPNAICNGMLRRTKISLNKIAQDATVALIRAAMEAGANIRDVYVDTVGPPEKYQERLSAIFPSLKFTVAKKADALYPSVSAASICAKVSRDRMLTSWDFQEALDIKPGVTGSGYPGDSTTVSFLTDGMDQVFGFPQLVRFSWSTSDKLLRDKAAPVEWEDLDAEPEAAQITSFFTKKRKRHAFFDDRNLEVATGLL